mmetsp:Transcript_39365/g.101987  ORF Transcript_39365/g.101987 Transcript_39365/m.101987 type:complete len:242 (+) Transcript_39365:209-934(+)|eukprot:jgi/Tetstr1/466536/TSEL_011040.t1
MRASVSWTGGKDCTLALLRACRDVRFEVVELVIFHPEQPVFDAHPLEVTKMQADALGLPVRYVVITAEPSYKESYVRGLREMKRDGIEAIVTGDIDYVGSMTTNWMEDCAHEAGLTCWLPLWQANREALLREMLHEGFEIVFSCVKSPWFGPQHIGKRLDSAMLSEILALAKETGLDATGERGEFHTMCLCSPLHAKRVCLEDVSARELSGKAGQGDQRWWVLDSTPCLKDKQQPHKALST